MIYEDNFCRENVNNSYARTNSHLQNEPPDTDQSWICVDRRSNGIDCQITRDLTSVRLPGSDVVEDIDDRHNVHVTK